MMRDIILRLLDQNMRLLCFNWLAIILIVAISFLVTGIYKLDSKKRMNRMFMYVSVSFLFIIGVAISIPTFISTVNLYRDFYELTIISKDGVVEDLFIISAEKRTGIVVDDERYIITSFAERPSEGDPCEFDYLKNSKYIISLEIIEKQ